MPKPKREEENRLPVLGYWNCRSLAEPIRQMLIFADVEFEDRRYHVFSKGKDCLSLGDWRRSKHRLGLAFPNLPYYMHGDTRITESLAILRFLARKHGLDTMDERERMDVIEQALAEFRSSFASLCHSSSFSVLKSSFLSDLPLSFLMLSQSLGAKPWLAGDRITYLDFLCHETLDWYRTLFPSVLTPYPNLMWYMRRYEALPKIKEYLESADFKKLSIFGPAAMFGSTRLDLVL